MTTCGGLHSEWERIQLSNVCEVLLTNLVYVIVHSDCESTDLVERLGEELTDMRHPKEAAAESEDGDSRRSTSNLHKIKRMEFRRDGRVRERRSRTRSLLYGIESMSGEAENEAVGNEVSGEDTDGRTGTPIDETGQSKEKYVSIDCEMVGVVGNCSGLAKCSILDYEGHVLFNEYIRPDEPIIDYRTRWSGIRPHHMKNAIPYEVAVQRI